jgi:thioredoxin-like negative regulator of GroEL
MLLRLVFLLLIAVAMAGLVIGVRRWSQWRLANLRSLPTDWEILGTAPDGRPAILAFSTPGCAVCRSAQQPALDLLGRQLEGQVRILKIDLTKQPDVATKYGVLTAPTTVVLGTDGRIVSYNNGFAPAEQLAAQLSAIGVSRASTA